MSVDPPRVHLPNASPAAVPIRFVDVTKRYRTGDAEHVDALRGVTLTIEPGAFAAIVGRSGSGKSTLLHLLAAMDTPTGGEVTVGEWRLAGLGPREQARFRRTMVGMIFQSFNLVGTMTARANVELPLLLAGIPAGDRIARAQACLDAVGLGHRATHRPAELSGGEQQRVAIARALVHDPPILLADEPTGNLDSATAADVVALLADVAGTRGKTVVVVTHHFSEIEAVATHRITLHDGSIAEEVRSS